MSTQKGRIGEDKACRYLKRKGYQILDRNVRRGSGEIDVIACKQDILAFIEVKAHQLRQRSIEAVHTEKQSRIVSAAQVWLAEHPEYATLQCRFDLIMLTPTQSWLQRSQTEHLKDAFRPF